MLQLPLFQWAHGCRLHVRAGSGLLMLAQSSSLWELHATVLHIAPIPHVVEHCGPNKVALRKSLCWFFNYLGDKRTEMNAKTCRFWFIFLI